MSHQGKSSELLAIKKMLDEGKRLRDVADEYFGSFIRHDRALKSYKRMVTRPRDFKSVVWLIVGPAGRGKSNFMRSFASAMGTMYVAPQAKGSGAYYDDYDGQECLVLDEFDGNSMTPTMFNTICDRYECVLPVHGGAGHQLVAKNIFIGSNYMPKYWWRKRSAAQLVQTTRRIDIVWKMGFRYGPAAQVPAKLAPIFKKNIDDPPGSKSSVSPNLNSGSLITYVDFLKNKDIVL